MAELVCPDCGNGQFTATLTTRTEYTYSADDRYGLCELSAAVVDGGDMGDIESLQCTDCCAEHADESELVTLAGYDHADCDPDECDDPYHESESELSHG